MTSEAQDFFKKILSYNELEVTESKEDVFISFVDNNMGEIQHLIQVNKSLVEKYRLVDKIRDITNQWVSLPNATVGKNYAFSFAIKQLGWDDMIFTSMTGLENLGLSYDNESELLSGCPIAAGDHKVRFEYRLKGEDEDSLLNVKILNFIVNPNPRLLWKNIESDSTDIYWKQDNSNIAQQLGDRHIVVASKRGRSHANVGSFRDDDFAFKHIESSQWNIVCVADGAGSATLARQGSKLACQSVIEYFETHLAGEGGAGFDKILVEHHVAKSEETSKSINHFVYENLSKAAYHVYKTIEEFSVQTGHSIKDFHTTLIFTLFKKYDFGYVFMSFSVGDCPISVISEGTSKVMLLNWLDVGDFGGGTRFVTMPEIFSSTKFVTRFSFKVLPEFTYLMLMTDGIYDPKFVVEANLEKIEKWKEFLEDLGGNNEEGIKVDLDAANEDVGEQLSAWMDFWSPGNHDDRTLAIIF